VVGRITAAAAIGLIALCGIACGDRTETAPERSPTEARGPDAGIALPRLYEAVRLSPDDPEARHDLAVALHQSGRSNEALEQFEKVVELQPEALHLIELGVAYVSVSKADEARAAFERALESSPGHPIALHHLGNLAEARGDPSEAISLYRQAVEHDPSYMIAHFHLAEALRNHGQLEAAYRSYEAVVKLEPTGLPDLETFDAALFQLGSLDLQMGATERAVEFLTLLVESVPDHPTAHLLLARALRRLGREEEARREMEVHERLATP
jgi:tetratricopeptide (TPR) repeat protein